MANSIDNVTNSFEGLGISNTASGNEVPLNRINSFLNILESSGNINIPEIWHLRGHAAKLADTARTLNKTVTRLNETLEKSVIAHVTTLGSRSASHNYANFPPQRLLTHFNNEIRRIVREVLSKPNNEDCFLWKVTEECYNQATGMNGTLCADEEEKESWIGFWVEALRQSPGGPTLFYSPASIIVSPDPDFEEVPQYLFRTFDENSPGKNNSNVIASQASILRPPEESRIDILSLDNHTATKRLYSHLKSLSPGNHSDNLMSWTSSMLFTLQHAIYKYDNFRLCAAADVKICAVDTRRFPRGQFARDMWLMRTYRKTAEDIGGEPENFFRFRDEFEKYWNGEYLSQGVVNHLGRSSVVSLETLIQSGLYKLYPDLEKAKNKKLLAKRVAELRNDWGRDNKTTREELQHAFEIAKTFDGCAALDIALILLTLKNRKYKSTMSEKNQHPPELDHSPPEVPRFLGAMNLVNQCKNRGVPVDMQMLQEVFECN